MPIKHTMIPNANQPHPSYKHIINQVWPIMLANMALPLLGLIDLAIIGHLGNASDLAALAIGAVVINFIFWNFGFLRMSTTALSAQAWGQANPKAIINIILRAMLIAIALALGIIIFKKPLGILATTILQPPAQALEGASTYIAIRLWAAPATLMIYVVTGLLIGLARSKSLLVFQLALNGLNAIFDILFAGIFHLGVQGIAYGTVAAETVSVFFGFYLLHLTWNNSIFQAPANHKNASPKNSHLFHQTYFDRNNNFFHFCKRMLFSADLWRKNTFYKILASNRDIWIRTLCILLSFMGFTYFSGQMHTDTLAANHLLLQIIVFSAFFLDSFAYLAEAYTGKAIGKKSKSFMLKSTYKISILAGITAFTLACVILLFGEALIKGLTNIETIQVIATKHLFLCAIYVALSVAAFQLDGIYIGANYTKALRNSAAVSAFFFFVLYIILFKSFNSEGLWWALITFVILRALSLFAYWPSLMTMSFEKKNNT